MIRYSYTQHVSGRDFLLSAPGDGALNVLAPALVHEGMDTDLGSHTSQIRVRYCVECPGVCLPPLCGVALGRGDFERVTLLLEVETTCCSVICLCVLTKIVVLESSRRLKDTRFQLASSRVQNIVGC